MLKKQTKRRNQTTGYWSRKADKKLQEIGRAMFEDKGCLICGSEYSCQHHYTPKSRSTHLRYNWKNLIPICAGCHLKHHNGNPTIHNAVNRIKGDDWVQEIEAEYRKGIGMNINGYVWYRDMYDKLCLIKPMKLSTQK